MRLTTRLFLLISFLIALVVGTAVAVTWYLSVRIGRQTISERLVKGDALRRSQDADLYNRLQLVANLFVADANLIAYLAEAQARSDNASILDLLLDRQEDLGFDFAIVTDPDGYLLARTDRLDTSEEDLSYQPLIALALDEYQSAGLWREGDKLYHAVVIPLVQGGIDLLGFFATAYPIDDFFAAESKRLDGSEVSYVLLGETPKVIASSYDKALSPTVRPLLEAIASTSVDSDPVIEINAADEPWLAHRAVLQDASGEPIALRLTAASLRKETAPFRRIASALGFVGLGSVMLGWLLTYALARWVTRPLTSLVTAARSARDGSYDVELHTQARQDEVGDLAREFNELLSELREKRDMEIYVAQLARSLPEVLPSPDATTRSPDKRLMTLLCVEYRHHASSLDRNPMQEIARLEEDLQVAAEVVDRLQGHAVAFAGHRLLAFFDGANHVIQAFEAALHLASMGKESETSPAVVFATGETTLGSVFWQNEAHDALCGRAVQILETLLREAMPGEVLLPLDTRDLLFANPTMPNLELPERQGLTTSLRYCTANPADARSLEPAVHAADEAADDKRPAFRPGQVVADRFEILALAGRGNMGTVYRARDRKLGDVVALKTLRNDLWRDQTRIEQLKQEIKIARKITHPHVLRVYDLGEVDGVPFLSMEYVPGVTLRQLLDKTRRLPYSACLRLARQICLGLQAVHAAGILHHDIKPANVMLEPTGNARLMDFGIARPISDDQAGEAQSTTTQGTPYYLAPEQLRGGEVDVRADIFGIGILLFEVFTGERPFRRGKNVAEVLDIKLHEQPLSPTDAWPEMPRQLAQLLSRCLEKEPRDRFPSMTELLAALDRVTRVPKPASA